MSFMNNIRCTFHSRTIVLFSAIPARRPEDRKKISFTIPENRGQASRAGLSGSCSNLFRSSHAQLARNTHFVASAAEDYSCHQDSRQEKTAHEWRCWGDREGEDMIVVTTTQCPHLSAFVSIFIGFIEKCHHSIRVIYSQERARQLQGDLRERR